MLRTNETRHIKWHGTCKCKCRLDTSVCNNKQHWNDDKYWCECKELIDKGVCDKGYIWNPSNCECECDKSCDVGEYLDYKNCKCRKKLDNKLVEECTKTVEVVKTASKNEHKNECSIMCIFYIVLFSILFAINVGIATYFVDKYMNRNEENVSKYDMSIKQKIININGRSQANRDQKSNLLFFQGHDQSQRFRIRLVENRQKVVQHHWYLQHWIYYD